MCDGLGRMHQDMCFRSYSRRHEEKSELARLQGEERVGGGGVGGGVGAGIGGWYAKPCCANSKTMGWLRRAGGPPEGLGWWGVGVGGGVGGWLVGGSFGRLMFLKRACPTTKFKA